MSKVKTAFFCQNCGARAVKWIGKCPSCNEWNTYVEEILESSSVKSWNKKSTSVISESKPQLLSDIAVVANHRIKIKDNELNRVLGNGLVPGSIVLMSGEPGIGKSTLLLQLALSTDNLKALYVSGEESEQQIKMRAERIRASHANCFILTETSLENILFHLEQIQPQLLVVDSIQTLTTSKIESPAGSVSQIRECASELLQYAKQTSSAVFLVGHVTKDGAIAGPKVLEHMVDTVLNFEGDRHHVYRILRTVKNRFGSTAELGIYEMQGAGLREVSNPSEVLISQREEKLSGVTIAATMEGIRPLLIEIQALVSSAVYGTPQRAATGFDFKRLNMLLAVLEKRCGFMLGAKDVFLNIAGGIKVEDPAIDLSIVCAILSSNADIPIEPDYCFAAEVGLSGEIRPVIRIEQRIAEAEKLGMQKIFISKYNQRSADFSRFKKIKIVPVAKVEEAFSNLFG